jgi:hypothetical protein
LVGDSAMNMSESPAMQRFLDGTRNLPARQRLAARVHVIAD